MFDGASPKDEGIFQPDTRIRPDESPDESYLRQVREWADYLGRLPGRRGNRLRRALTNGWC